MKRETTDTAAPVSEPTLTVPLARNDLVLTILAGASVGIASLALTFLMNKFIFAAVLCRAQSPGGCEAAPTYAMIVAMVLGAIIGLVALVRLRIYRPLLVVLAASIALWGYVGYLLPLAWYISGPISAALFGLAYALFMWLACVRSFVFAIVLSVVAVVVIRFATSL